MSRNPSDDNPILAAWQQQLAHARTNPFLLQLLLKQFQRVLKRLAYFYAQLASLPRKKRRALQRALATSLVGAAMLLALSSAPAVHAASITVSGPCTLDEAITNANDDAATFPDCAAGSGADTIYLTGNITLGGFLPTITSEITLEGGNFYVSGADTFRVFYVTSTGDFTINETTIQNGSASYGSGIYNDGVLEINDSALSGNNAYFSGGAIFNGTSATLTITNSTLSGNSALFGDGGAIFNGTSATLTITNSTLSGNTAGDDGGAIFNNSGATLTITNSTLSGNSALFGDGGAIFNNSGATLTITNSTLNSNHATNDGGAIFNDDNGMLTITNSTLSGNSADSDGGAIENDYAAILFITNSTLSGNDAGNDGGAIYNDEEADLIITNSTLSGNDAGDDGGAIYNNEFGDLLLINGTLSGNTAGDNGGAIYNFEFGTTGLNRTLISGNSATDRGDEIYNRDGGTINASNFNLFGDDSKDNAAAFANYFTPGASDITATSNGTLPTALASILDTALADNGSSITTPTGIVQTLALISGSPALDKAPNADCSEAIGPPDFGPGGLDQRAFPRNVDFVPPPSANDCDIGAFELQVTTAVNVANVRASAQENKNVLKWRTLTESQISGFNIYRKVGKQRWKQINAQFKQAKNPGDVQGNRYAFRDKKVNAGKTYRYKLEVVYLDGHSEWTEIVRVTAR